MKPVLLDTGPIVALLDRSERYHDQCVRIIAELRAPLVTCEAVIAKSCYLLRNLAGAGEAVLANVESGVFLLPFRLDESASAIRGLMKKYRKVSMDFADACLTCLAQELLTGTILTLDRDFTVYRWQRNRPFENLIDVG
jgi:uncharacterized protein